MIRTRRPSQALSLQLVFALVATMLVGTAVGATASTSTRLDVLVSEDPVNWTPQLTGDRVVAIETVSGVVAAGGLFTQAKVPGGTNQPAGNFQLFVDGTGELLPSPSFDKEVYAIEPAADGQSFYVAGRFKNVNGSSRRGLARVALDGTIMSSWTPFVDWSVSDIALVGDTLFVGGNFNKINGQDREGLAALDANTGALLSWAPNLTDPKSTDRTVGARSVDKLDVTPDGTRLVIVGNFSKIDGQARHLAAMFDLAGPSIQLADWRVDDFAAPCRATKWPQYIRDMDVSPNGDYVLFGTTGAYGSPTGSQLLCDTITRVELASTGNVKATWRSYSGGDTFYGVVAAGDIAYYGGHHRWMNNPYRADREGAGAVDRYGIGALDARTGVPLEWDPRRDPRGLGTFELSMSDAGLWVGQDTDYIGGEYHSLIALMPASGGRTIARPAAGDTAAGIMLIDGDGTASKANAAAGGAQAGTVSLGFNDSKVGGATMIGENLLVAETDGDLFMVANGGTGSATTVDTNGLITDGYFVASQVTSMFFDEQTSMLYYTRSGSSTLRGRGFSPDGNIVEALEFTISTSSDGFSWSNVSGAYIHNGFLYVARSNKATLDRIAWDRGPVAGTLSTLPTDGVNYTGTHNSGVRDLVGLGTSASASNDAPTAGLDVTCEGLTCWADAGDSYDWDGYIASISLKVDGNVVGTKAASVVELPSAGTYGFTVTVTDDRGATANKTVSVTVSGNVTFIDAANENRWSTAPDLTIPTTVKDDTYALLTVTSNSSDSLGSAPVGPGSWTELGRVNSNRMESVVFGAFLQAADAGSTLSVPMIDGKGHKSDITLTMYSGVRVSSPVFTSAAAEGLTVTAQHVTPTRSTSISTLAVSIWSDKTPAGPGYTASAGQLVRSSSAGDGGGRIATLVTDGGALTAAGSIGGKTATAWTSTLGYATFTVALRPA